MDNKPKTILRLDDNHREMLTKLCKTLDLGQTDCITYLLDREQDNKRKNPVVFMLDNDDLNKLTKYLKLHGMNKNDLISIWLGVLDLSLPNDLIEVD